MSRFTVGLVCLLALTGSFPVAGQIAVQSTRREPTIRPNIMLVVLDDVGYDLLDDACTPTLDRLGATGLTLKRFYASPVCSPTRAQLLRGTYSYRNGIGISLNSPDESGWSLRPGNALPRRLGRGYATAAVGKWHLSAPQPAIFEHPREIGFDRFRVTSFNLDPDNYYDYELNVDGFAIRSTTYATTRTTDDAIKLIQSMPSPWFTYVAYHAPHSPYDLPPAALQCDPVAAIATERDIALRMLEALDRELARLLAVAERNRAYVFVVSDNGTAKRISNDPQRAKATLYESGVRVPAWVIGPDVIPGVTENLVQAADVYATILDLADRQPPAVMDGVSFRPYLNGDHAPRRSFVFLERFSPAGLPVQSIDHARMACNGNYKLINRILGQTTSYELYNLATDPGETTNLFPPRAGQTVLLQNYQQLRGILDTHRYIHTRPRFDATSIP